MLTLCHLNLILKKAARTKQNMALILLKRKCFEKMICDLLVEIPARTTDEPRSIVIGQISGKCWSGVITYREQVIRIISVRRSRPDEVQFMKAEEFDNAFDEGLDMTSYLDMSKVQRSEQPHKRVNVVFPLWMINSLDKEATRLGVSRQSVIKVWLGERLQQQKATS